MDHNDVDKERYEDALKRIVELANEYEANRLGGAELQRQRWRKLGDIADVALRLRLPVVKETYCDPECEACKQFYR